MSPSGPDVPATRPIRRLRVVSNPAATGPAPTRSGGRHRKPDTGELPVQHLAAVDGEAAVTDTVPAQRVGRTIRPAAATLPVPPGA